MKAKALQECDQLTSKYAQCAPGRKNISVVWHCRKQASELNICLKQLSVFSTLSSCSCFHVFLLFIQRSYHYPNCYFMEEALYNIQFEQHWLETQTDRQSLGYKADWLYFGVLLAVPCLCCFAIQVLGAFLPNEGDILETVEVGERAEEFQIPHLD